MFSNFFIESGLGETRLIRFVVTMAAIRNNIHKYIAMKLLSEFKRQFCHIGNGIKIISVHMKNRGKRRLRDIRAVGARAAFKIIRREPHLIVEHHMNRSSYVITRQLRHLKYLIDNALACNRSISMNQNRNEFVYIPMVTPVDLSS